MAPSAARSVPSGSQSKPTSTPLSAMSGSDVPMVIDADSLREAALRSLKSKRLKADANNASKPLPAYSSGMKIRPPPPSMSLDYGAPSPATTPATATAVMPAPIPTTAPAPITEDAEKEEGEISEGEDIPPPPPLRHMKARPTIVVPEKALSDASASTAPMDVDSPQDRIGSITLPAQGVGPPPMAPPDFLAGGPALPDPLPASWSSHMASLAAQHSLSLTRVRPDLNVTAAELQEAKDIILDLLGWGVPVQYIHEQQGVSRQLIVYCFDELKLRLPPDFSREGVKPYPPPPEFPPSPSSAIPLTSSYSLPATSRTAPPPSSAKHSNNLPSASPKLKPPTTPTFNPLPTISTLPRPPTSLPAKPPPPNAAHVRQGSGRFGSITGVPPRPVPQPPTPVQPPPPPPPATRGGVDLREIENQRRLELQARKAARTPAPQPETPRVPVPPPTPTATASAATPPAQIPNVDAFLQDIQQQATTAPPTPQPIHNNRTFSGPVVQSPEPMDIDFGSPALTTTLLPPRSEPPAPTPQSSPSIPQTNGMKRGVKRPVASDFPDFDNAPPALRPHPSGRQAVFPLKKRTSFAPQTNFNMIIHLSDTEEESEGDDCGSDGDRPRRTARKGPISKKAKTSGARSTPTGLETKAAEPLDAKATAEAKAKHLAEELQRMKEMILRKEAERAKRKANAIGTASPSAELSTSSSAPVTAPVSPRAPRPQPASPIASRNEELDIPKSPTPSSTATPFEQDVAMADADPTSSPDTADDIAMTLETTTTPHSSPPPPDSDTGKDDQGSSPSMPPMLLDASLTTGEGTLPVADVSSQTRFLPYDSPFNPFSRLHARSLLAEMSSIPTPGHSTSDRIGTSADPISIDLTPLKLVALGKIDPARQLCRFEIPGRGECKEEQCEDVHRSDYDPTDDDTARYVTEHWPTATPPSLDQIKTALQQARQQLTVKASLDSTANPERPTFKLVTQQALASLR